MTLAKIDRYNYRFPDGGDRPRYALELPVAGFAHRYEARLLPQTLNQPVPVIPDIIGNAHLTAQAGRSALISQHVSGSRVLAFTGSTEANYASYPGSFNPLSGPMRTVVALLNATHRDVDAPMIWGNTGSPYPLNIQRTALNAWRASSTPSWTRTSPTDTASFWTCVAVTLDGANSQMYVGGELITGSGTGSTAFTHLGLGGRATVWGRFQFAAAALHPGVLSQDDIRAVEAQWRFDYFGTPLP